MNWPPFCLRSFRGWYKVGIDQIISHGERKIEASFGYVTFLDIHGKSSTQKYYFKESIKMHIYTFVIFTKP